MSKKIWVSSQPNGGWRVHKEDSRAEISHHQTKADAIAKARQIAKNQATELTIRGKDGKILAKDSYGRDPFPPRDRRK